MCRRYKRQGSAFETLQDGLVPGKSDFGDVSRRRCGSTAMRFDASGPELPSAFEDDFEPLTKLLITGRSAFGHGSSARVCAALFDPERIGFWMLCGSPRMSRWHAELASTADKPASKVFRNEADPPPFWDNLWRDDDASALQHAEGHEPTGDADDQSRGIGCAPEADSQVSASPAQDTDGLRSETGCHRTQRIP